MADTLGALTGLFLLFGLAKLVALLPDAATDVAYLVLAPPLAVGSWRLLHRVDPEISIRLLRKWGFWLPAACGFYLLDLANFFLPGEKPPVWLVWVVIVACWLLLLVYAAAETARSKRNVINVSELEMRPEQPVMLLLRSFGADQRLIDTRSVPALAGGFLDEHSFTEWLAEEAAGLGLEPYRVGGRSGEIKTVATDGQNWRQVVERLLDRAQLVLLIPGGTDGVRWEIQQLLARHTFFDQTLLVFPPESRGATLRRWRDFQQVLEDNGVSLPPLPETAGQPLAVRLHLKAEPEWVIVDGAPDVDSYREAVRLLGFNRLKDRSSQRSPLSASSA